MTLKVTYYEHLAYTYQVISHTKSWQDQIMTRLVPWICWLAVLKAHVSSCLQLQKQTLNCHLGHIVDLFTALLMALINTERKIILFFFSAFAMVISCTQSTGFPSSSSMIQLGVAWHDDSLLGCPQRNGIHIAERYPFSHLDEKRQQGAKFVV